VQACLFNRLFDTGALGRAEQRANHSSAQHSAQVCRHDQSAPLPSGGQSNVTKQTPGKTAATSWGQLTSNSGQGQRRIERVQTIAPRITDYCQASNPAGWLRPQQVAQHQPCKQAVAQKNKGSKRPHNKYTSALDTLRQPTPQTLWRAMRRDYGGAGISRQMSNTTQQTMRTSPGGLEGLLPGRTPPKPNPSPSSSPPISWTRTHNCAQRVDTHANSPLNSLPAAQQHTRQHSTRATAWPYRNHFQCLLLQTYCLQRTTCFHNHLTISQDASQSTPRLPPQPP
jgi:hypothetical protein